MRGARALALGMAVAALPLWAQAAAKQEKSKSEASSAAHQKTEARGNAGALDQAINPQEFDEAELAELTFDLTNRERRKAGLPAFRKNVTLFASAREHSVDMAQRGYFSHKSKGFFNRTNPMDRVEQAGMSAMRVAENIAMVPTYTGQTIMRYPGYSSQVVKTNYSSYRQVAETAVKEWMNSPGHRANILSPQLSSLGIGVAVGMKDNVPFVYFTQNFGG